MKPTPETKAVGVIVTRLIKQSGNTVETVAHMLGASWNTVMAWRKGDSVIPYQMIDKMCHVLSIRDVDRLYLISAAQLAIVAKWRER